MMKTLGFALAFLIFLVHYTVVRKEFPVHSDGAILISGTSSGIGRATCGWLAEQHPQITVYCGVRREIQGSPFDLPNVKQVTLDITNQEHVDAVLQQIEQAQQPLIAVVNNAGLYDMNTFEFLGAERLRKVLEVNVVGTYQLTQAALPALRESKGRIVAVSSISGLVQGTPLMTAYQSSKHALEVMFDVLRVEVAPHDVSVSLIAPGWLESNILEDVKVMQEKAMPKSDQNATLGAMEIYLHVVGASYMSMFTEVATTTGRMEETCDSIDDAIFGKYPKPRYVTSRVGAMPAWLAAAMLNALPTRLVDIASSNLEPIVYMIRVRAFLEHLLGMA
ncbi:Short-chain dehydrogenase/reductase family 9C member 7 [Seminavis robusta]|uniref:Short-chain dehydrogenase/reductase family 9C member 7 n=1 Tax=Seminavis robusta TaxID=568900 RepID=A0A9N8DGK6_9STRA|nr:Short-chain dehydrogenase/reductase family 9C member 7 [Seminavis robusta]|eukprot:Sro77_g042010.1 Short-chain dehydrogenase/reductase family 9C member 7 (334) ;mRNA; f:51990-52991